LPVAGPTIPEIRTDRLMLRGWRHADRGRFAELNADPQVAEFLGGPLDRDASDALVDRILVRWDSDGHGLWAVERVEDGRFLGFVGLAAPSFHAVFSPCVEVGWRLAREAWGRGYATEAARAALRFGFVELDLDEIVSFTTVANVRSRAVMERLGMTRDPVDDFDHPSFPDGHPIRPHVLYRLGRERWRASITGTSATSG
jgi:RimJ/RimL family protein N-acetyltransferase